jgi:lysophospholipase L1-like esterase
LIPKEVGLADHDLTASRKSHEAGEYNLKHRFGLSAWDIAAGAGTLAEMVTWSEFGPAGRAPEVLLLAPPPTCAAGRCSAEMFAGADEKSAALGEQYGRVAAELGCEFLDTSTVIVSSELDGIHLDASEHAKLGQAVAAAVRRILG